MMSAYHLFSSQRHVLLLSDRCYVIIVYSGKALQPCAECVTRTHMTWRPDKQQEHPVVLVLPLPGRELSCHYLTWHMQISKESEQKLRKPKNVEKPGNSLVMNSKPGCLNTALVERLENQQSVNILWSWQPRCSPCILDGDDIPPKRM